MNDANELDNALQEFENKLNKLGYWLLWSEEHSTFYFQNAKTGFAAFFIVEETTDSGIETLPRTSNVDEVIRSKPPTK